MTDTDRPGMTRRDPIAYGLTDDTYLQLATLVQALEGLAILFETCPAIPAQGEVGHLTPTLACLGNYGSRVMKEIEFLKGQPG